MVEIIDNTRKRVVDYIKTHIKGSKEVKFAIGYFFLSGWNLVKNDFPESAENGFLKIVIGDETTEITRRELAKGYNLKLKMLEELSELEDSSKIKELYELIRQGKIDIRIYTQSKLHSKLYLFIKRPEELFNEFGESPGLAIVGSSNFTARGLAQNKELNVLLTDRNAIIELSKWFDNLWAESEDFREELLKILELAKEKKIDLGKFVTPRELFKLLVWKWFDGRVEPIEKKDILAEFQLIGVINAINIINKHNGVIIADSVGLGKSFIGASIIEEYIVGKLPDWDPNKYGISKDRKALLILPPSLIPQWEHLLFKSGYFFSGQIYSKQKPTTTERIKIYEIYKKTDDGILKLGEVALMSLGIFSNYSERDIVDLGLNYDYDLILIDEAHKFRNRQTNRWKNARMLRFKDHENPSLFQNKFILLTATPLNNTIWDIYNLIKLFSDDLFSTFKAEGVNVTQLFQEFKDLKKKWKESPKYESELRIKAQEIKEKVLDEIMILRTRRYIKETFGKDGKIKVGDKELVFKEPEPEKVFYDDISNCKEYWNFLKEVGMLLENLEFAYTKLYTSGFVVIGNSSSSLFEEKPEEIEEETVAVPIDTILKLLLSKRLESSIFAFEKTLDKIYSKNLKFYEILKDFSTKIDELSLDKFIKELEKIGDQFIAIAEKEDIIRKLTEEEDLPAEYQYNPKVRMLHNFISKGLGTEALPLPEFKDEKELFDELKKKPGILSALKKGIKLMVEELQRDKEIMEKIKAELEKVKIKDKLGNPITLGEIRDEDGTYPVYTYKDPKFEKLKQLMYSELVGRKYIIFTQYKDTAEYIYRNLENWIRDQKTTLTYLFDTKRCSLKIGLVTGDLAVEEKERMIKRFAPDANDGYDVVNRLGELMILVSTDTLSEGVNLQDGDGVINYDLPWNPMIIVQRVGRVSRIGNEKDVFVKNFVPVQEIEISLGILAKLQEKIKDITLLVGKEFYILSADEEEISIETFGEKLKSLAELSISQLEEVSASEDLKLIKGGIPEEVLAEFELLDFVQNKLGLKKQDFEDILPLVSSKKPVYTLVNGGKVISMFEVYRGNRKIGKKVVVYENGKLIESTCREFIRLWDLSEAQTEGIDLAKMAELISEVRKEFREEILPKHRSKINQTGLIRDLWNYLYQLLRQKQLTQTIDRNKLKKVLTYLAWSELNSQERKEFKEHLIKTEAIKEKGSKLEVTDPAKLIDVIYDYFKIGDIDKKLYEKLIGWWY